MFFCLCFQFCCVLACATCNLCWISCKKSCKKEEELLDGEESDGSDNDIAINVGENPAIEGSRPSTRASLRQSQRNRQNTSSRRRNTSSQSRTASSCFDCLRKPETREAAGSKNRFRIIYDYSLFVINTQKGRLFKTVGSDLFKIFTVSLK